MELNDPALWFGILIAAAAFVVYALLWISCTNGICDNLLELDRMSKKNRSADES